ncbi:MAG: hypothetical protein H7Y32_09675, partial [Chloroflexales bacterium]|nr:hypothetical protein [Chloroflexales bacterium]
HGAWGAALALLVVVQSWVYLGHTGFLLNTVTLAAVGVPLLLWRAWRGPYRRAALQVAGAVLAGGLVVGAFYYSAFLPLILSQLGGVASVGLLEVTNRRPVPPAETLRAIWQDGILIHYGFFPLPLALCGLTMLFSAVAQRRRALKGERAALSTEHSALSAQHSALSAGYLLKWLIALTFLVSLSQAVLPLVTRSTLTTRYLMFAAWAVALAAAPVLRSLWRHGWAGRIVVLAMALFVAWGTLTLWAGALLYNIAPPEPF